MSERHRSPDGRDRDRDRQRKRSRSPERSSRHREAHEDRRRRSRSRERRSRSPPRKRDSSHDRRPRSRSPQRRRGSSRSRSRSPRRRESRWGDQPAPGTHATIRLPVAQCFTVGGGARARSRPLSACMRACAQATTRTNTSTNTSTSSACLRPRPGPTCPHAARRSPTCRRPSAASTRARCTPSGPLASSCSCRATASTRWCTTARSALQHCWEVLRLRQDVQASGSSTRSLRAPAPTHHLSADSRGDQVHPRGDGRGQGQGARVLPAQGRGEHPPREADAGGWRGPRRAVRVTRRQACGRMRDAGCGPGGGRTCCRGTAKECTGASEPCVAWALCTLWAVVVTGVHRRSRSRSQRCRRT